MNTFKRITGGLYTLLLISSLFCGTAWAAGTVVFVSGTASAQRGSAVIPLSVNVPVKSGDVVQTGPASLLQLRMDDGGLISLKASSRLDLQTYVAPLSGAQSGGRAVLKLLKGGLRTLTGTIGSANRDEYELGTPVATIGIRGTDYSVLYCNADCAQAPDGLHARVSRGAILIRNLSGDELLLRENEYAWIKDGSTAPSRGLEPPVEMSMVPSPPPNLRAAPSRPIQIAVDDKAGIYSPEEASSAPDLDITGNEPSDRLRPSLENPNQPFAYVPDGDDGTRSKLGFASDLSIDGNNSLTGFNGEDGAYAIGSAQQRDVGFDPDTGIRWGRWSGGDALIAGEDVSLQDRSVAWIYGQPFDDAPALPLSGSAEFTLSGNTSPTDTAGNIGFLGAANLTANFSEQTVFSSLSLGIGNSIWDASGSGTLSPESGLFGGNYSVLIDSSGNGSGQFNGFVLPDVSGAGLGYSLTDGESTISGTAAFRANEVAP